MAEVKNKLTGGVLTASDEQAERLVAAGSFERVAEPKKATRIRKPKAQ